MRQYLKNKVLQYENTILGGHRSLTLRRYANHVLRKQASDSIKGGVNFKNLLKDAGLFALSIITANRIRDLPMRMKANAIVDQVQEISNSLPEISRVDFQREAFELEGLKDALEDDSLDYSERLEKVDSLLKEFLGKFREVQTKSSKAKAQAEMLALMEEDSGKSFDDIYGEYINNEKSESETKPRKSYDELAEEARREVKDVRRRHAVNRGEYLSCDAFGDNCKYYKDGVLFE